MGHWGFSWGTWGPREAPLSQVKCRLGQEPGIGARSSGEPFPPGADPQPGCAGWQPQVSQSRCEPLTGLSCWTGDGTVGSLLNPPQEEDAGKGFTGLGPHPLSFQLIIGSPLPNPSNPNDFIWKMGGGGLHCGWNLGKVSPQPPRRPQRSTLPQTLGGQS